jgi:hypothetical protein
MSIQISIEWQLKSYIQRFLWQRAVGCHIERIRHSVDDKSATTRILIEAEACLAYAAKKDLIEAIRIKFPHIPVPPNDSQHWIVESSFEVLTAAKIGQTPSGIRREDSSGAVSSSISRAEPDLDALSLTSSIRRALLDLPGINVVSRVLQATGKLNRIMVHLHYADLFIAQDVTIMDWNAMTEAARKELPISLPIRGIWHFVHGQWGRVADMDSLENGHHYYITAETDPDPTASPHSSVPVSPEIAFASMEEFYVALRAKGCDEEDICIITDLFQQQRVRVGVLCRLTDEILKETGLILVGLRQAVLSVLGK